MKLPPLSISYLYSILTDKQTESLKGLGVCASVEAQACVEPSQSGKCMGLVVRVTDIKKMTKCIRIIYSTNMSHLRVTHGDRERKTGRET